MGYMFRCARITIQYTNVCTRDIVVTMNSNITLCVFLWFTCLTSLPVTANHEEPKCVTSRYDFESQLLERSIVLSHDMKILKEMVNTKLEELKSERESMKTDLSTALKQLTEVQHSKNEELTSLAETINNGFQDKLEQTDKEISTTLAEKIADMNNQMTLHQSQMSRMSNDLRTLTNETLNNVKGKRVAFSVTSPNTQLVNGISLFNTVITNIGGGYNVQTGQFTCTEPGVYLFSLTIQANSNNVYTHCYIRLNTANKAISYASTAQYQSSTVDVILELKTGNIVDVGGCGHWNKIETSAGNTVFNGVLIS